MDPIAQIFQQAQAPTGKWDLPAQMFIQGRQLGQSQQRLNMQQQEQDIMLPLEAEAKRLAANSTMLDLQIKRNALERDNQIKAGELELSQILLDAGNYPDGLANPELVARGHRVSVVSPAAFSGDMGKAYMSGTQAAFAANRAIKQFGKPTKVTISPTGAESLTFDEGQLTAATRTREQLQKDIDEAEAAGDFARADALIATRDKDLNQQKFRATTLTQAEQRLKDTKDWRALSASMRGRGLDQREVDLAMQQFKEGMNVEVAPTPDEATQQWLGHPKVKISSTERPLTMGTTTDLQKSNTKLDTAISDVKYAVDQVEAHPEYFGPKGWVAEKEELVKGLFDPNAPAPATGTRTTAGNAVHDLVVGLRTDPNVSNYERKAIDDVVGKPEQFWSTPNRIKAKFGALNEVMIARRIRQGKALHQPINPALLDQLQDSEHVKSMQREGTLTRDEAISWARTHLPAN